MEGAERCGGGDAGLFIEPGAVVADRDGVGGECGACCCSTAGVGHAFAMAGIQSFVAVGGGKRVCGGVAGFGRDDLPEAVDADRGAEAGELGPDDPLLKSSALSEVERTENAYVQAIDKLAVEAKPQLDSPETPLLANYREKLQVLDSAIDDLRAQAGDNPSNAHLRYQLLAMYQEKQRTLEEVLEAKR